MLQAVKWPFPPDWPVSPTLSSPAYAASETTSLSKPPSRNQLLQFERCILLHLDRRAQHWAISATTLVTLPFSLEFSARQLTSSQLVFIL